MVVKVLRGMMSGEAVPSPPNSPRTLGRLCTHIPAGDNTRQRHTLSVLSVYVRRSTHTLTLTAGRVGWAQREVERHEVARGSDAIRVSGQHKGDLDDDLPNRS